jgi:hypothetical protein
MPEGQLTNLILDPNTGGVITPGVIVNDDFETDKLVNYTDYVGYVPGPVLPSKSYATVALGRLQNLTVNTVGFRNNRPFVDGNSLYGMSTGFDTHYNLTTFPKILSNTNYLLVQTYDGSPGRFLVYQMLNGTLTRVDANDIIGPAIGDGFEWWLVCRIASDASNNTRFTVQVYKSQPYMFFPPYQVREYLVAKGFSNNSTPGYSGIMIDSRSTVDKTDAYFTEWVVTDDTIKTVF